MAAALAAAAGVRLATLGAVAAATVGCGAQGAEQGCPSPLACGGNPTGTWRFAGLGCQARVPSPYKPISLYPQQTVPQSPSLSKPPASSTTGGNWCSDLVYLPPSASNPRGQVMNVALFANPAPLTSAELIFRSDHTYNIAVNFQGVDKAHFTPECIGAYGAAPTCADLATAIQQFYIEPPPFSNIACTRAADQGCDCTYDYENPVVDMGLWSTDGTLLYEYSSLGQQPYPATYCVSGSGPGAQLTVTGYQGRTLTNIPGLRTIVAVQAM
jgi:hypothetical protein